MYDDTTVWKSECSPLTMGRWMSKTDLDNGFIYQIGNVDIASFNEDGGQHPRKEAVFPFELKFVPNREILIPTD